MSDLIKKTKGPKQAAIDVVELVREIKSRPPEQLPGDLAAMEIFLAAAEDIIDELRAKLAAGIEYLEKLQICADSYETVNGCIFAIEHLKGEYISGLVAPQDPQPSAPDAAGLFHDRVHKDAGRSRVAKVAPRRPASKPLSHKMIHERTNSADEIRANIRKPPAPEPPSEIKAPPMSDELLSDLGFGEPEPPSAGAVDTLDDIVNLGLSGVAIGGKVMPALRSDIDECLAYLRTVCKPDPA